MENLECGVVLGGRIGNATLLSSREIDPDPHSRVPAEKEIAEDLLARGPSEWASNGNGSPVRKKEKGKSRIVVPHHGQYENRSIWKIFWDTGNTVNTKTVQSGKFSGIRETRSIRKPFNLGNFLGYRKHGQYENRSIWEIFWERGNTLHLKTVQSGKFFGIAPRHAGSR